jgi:hypothetical protein
MYFRRLHSTFSTKKSFDMICNNLINIKPTSKDFFVENRFKLTLNQVIDFCKDDNINALKQLSIPSIYIDRYNQEWSKEQAIIKKLYDVVVKKNLQVMHIEPPLIHTFPSIQKSTKICDRITINTIVYMCSLDLILNHKNLINLDHTLLDIEKIIWINRLL